MRKPIEGYEVKAKVHNYSKGIKIKSEPLPEDKRRKPWPTIRKYKWKCKTQEEYFSLLLEKYREGFYKYITGQ